MYFEKQKYEEINFLEVQNSKRSRNKSPLLNQTVTTDGIKVVPAGAIWPANDATARESC